MPTRLAALSAALEFTALVGVAFDGSGRSLLGVANAAPAQATAERTSPAMRREPPLPAFEGWTLDDERLSVSDWIGRRFLVFLFNPETAGAAAVGDAVAAIAAERGEHNFGILGVAQGSSAEKARRFLSERTLEIPTLLDPSGEFGARIGARVPVGLLLVDAEGYVVEATATPADADEAAPLVETLLRRWLRLPDRHEMAAVAAGERPLAPAFQAPRLEGGPPFELASLRGRPAVVVFFLHTCPHCHSALRFLKKTLAGMPEEGRPSLVGVSVMNRTHSVQAALEEEDLDFFPVVLDPDESIQRSFGALGGVPILFLLDAEGRIVWRIDGWRDERDPPLLRMRLARLAKQKVPMLLHKTGYSGNEFCAVCHEGETATWELTNHAGAFETLVKHGADRNAECVGCHVVGFDRTDGYDLATPDAALEDVGCETCHGRGGPHLSPDFVTGEDYEAVCVTCHNPTHSLGFDYTRFLPRVSHAANAALASLPEAERRRALADRRQPRKDLLPTSADYVGSEACRSCHPDEYTTWSAQPHASAFRTLEEKGKGGQAECLACHVTALGKPGGFPLSGSAREHPELAAVGCESCHGPGSEHVGPDAKKIGTIVSLGDKCDSCVILKICGSCHDDANDPGFEFEVLDKIEAQRHGTIEAGTGRPKGEQTALPESAVIGALEEALRRTGADGSSSLRTGADGSSSLRSGADGSGSLRSGADGSGSRHTGPDASGSRGTGADRSNRPRRDPGRS